MPKNALFLKKAGKIAEALGVDPKLLLASGGWGLSLQTPKLLLSLNKNYPLLSQRKVLGPPWPTPPPPPPLLKSLVTPLVTSTVFEYSITQIHCCNYTFFRRTSKF